MSTNATPRKPRNQKPSKKDPGTEKDTSPKGSEEKVDEQLDHELEDSFPASDPPSLTQDPK